MKLGRFFALADFDCHDGTDVPDDLVPRVEELVRGVLDPLREAWGAPLIVVSGYRSEVYNKRVGGASQSQHVQGRAADVRPTWDQVRPGESRATCVKRLHAIALHMQEQGLFGHLGGLGLYPRWIHVDTRPGERLARWTGAGLGSEIS